MSTTRMIWCERCYFTNADDVARWAYEGRGAAVEGVLRGPIECGSCDTKLQAGARVAAITVLHPGPWFERWEWTYLAEENPEPI
jgi:hypothetical protein